MPPPLLHYLPIKKKRSYKSEYYRLKYISYLLNITNTKPPMTINNNLYRCSPYKSYFIYKMGLAIMHILLL